MFSYSRGEPRSQLGVALKVVEKVAIQPGFTARLINFHLTVSKDGIRRLANNDREPTEQLCVEVLNR